MIAKMPYFDPELLICKLERARDLRKALGTLKAIEKRVLELRYGLVNGQCHSLASTGYILGYTREKIRQFEARGLRKLRGPGQLRNNWRNWESLHDSPSPS